MDARPRTWAAFFESIPTMEIQKQGDFAYRAHQATSGEVGVMRGRTKQGRLAELIFGHLVAEQLFWRLLLGPVESHVEPTAKPVHVVHHMAYDCGDLTLFVHDLLDVYWMEEHDKNYNK